MMRTKKYRPYTKSGRLSDVLALIQVLAFDKSTHRSNLILTENERLGSPSSADSWTTVATEHPEIFRVNKEKERAISLVARHVTPKDAKGTHEPLSADFTQVLIKSAIDADERAAVLKAIEHWESGD